MRPDHGNTCIYTYSLLKMYLPKMLCGTVLFGDVKSICPDKDVAFLKV